jgi:hypothetical protein
VTRPRFVAQRLAGLFSSPRIAFATTGLILRFPESQYRIDRVETGKARASFVCQRGMESSGTLFLAQALFDVTAVWEPKAVFSHFLAAGH